MPTEILYCRECALSFRSSIAGGAESEATVSCPLCGCIFPVQDGRKIAACVADIEGYLLSAYRRSPQQTGNGPASRSDE